MARVSVEDCQLKIPNRFQLVLVAANRARKLIKTGEPLLKTKNREAVTALREIAEELVLSSELPVDGPGEVLSNLPEDK